MAGKNTVTAQSVRARKLSDAYREMYEKLERHLLNQERDTIRISILLDHILLDFEEAQDNNRDVQSVVGKNFRDYVRKIDKSIDFKSEYENQKRIDYEKFIISGIWFTICAYLVLLFFKEFLNQAFLINIYVDMLVAIIAFYLALNNILNHVRILKRHNLSIKALQIEVVGLVVAIFIVLISLKSPFDISFLILVVTYLSSKKLAKAAFEKNLIEKS